MPVPCSTKHIQNFRANLADVIRLIQIHRDLSGSERGRRVGVECLNKSAIVLILASWEAFVEDLAESAFDCMLANAPDHTVFPNHVLTLAWADFKKAQTADAFTSIATGWKVVLSNYRNMILEKFIVKGSFNTPSGPNCNNLFTTLIGLHPFTGSWTWKITRSNVTSDDAEKLLQTLIDLRGEIAHRATTAKAVQKQVVQSHAKLVTRLAVRSHNEVRRFLIARLGFDPCPEFSADDEAQLLDDIKLVITPSATPAAQIAAPVAQGVAAPPVAAASAPVPAQQAPAPVPIAAPQGGAIPPNP